MAPLNAVIWSEVLHAAEVPKGVYNMVQGDGPTVGAAMSAHPGIDMMSFTGSTRAGVLVAQAAAPTVKRVAQELGGKSANILLPDVDFQRAVTRGVTGMTGNSGQSCNAPTSMFVPADRHDEVKRIAKVAAETVKVGAPGDAGSTIGPVVSAVQFDKVQRLIQAGVDEGAELVTGGLGRPGHLNRGYYVRPTVFAGVRNGMTIAREEIFGPVLAILPYADQAEAVRLANDTVYGLAAYVQSGDPERGRKVGAAARRQRVPELSGLGFRGAVRRLQAIRQRPRIRPLGARRVPGDQGGGRLRSRLTPGGARGRVWSGRERRFQLLEVSGQRAMRVAFHGAVGVDHADAERGQAGAAAADAAAAGLDHRQAERLVQRVDQQPGAAIAHRHGPAGGRDRSGLVQQFQQPDLARTERPVGAEIDAQGQPCHGAV